MSKHKLIDHGQRRTGPCKGAAVTLVRSTVGFKRVKRVVEAKAAADPNKLHERSKRGRDARWSRRALEHRERAAAREFASTAPCVDPRMPIPNDATDAEIATLRRWLTTGKV